MYGVCTDLYVVAYPRVFVYVGLHPAAAVLGALAAAGTAT